MPEGDTIFRAAETLHRALAGRTVVRFESVLPALTRVHADAPMTGRTLERVYAIGKHLLMRFSALPRGSLATGPRAVDHPAFSATDRLAAALVLRTHMRMNGSWHIYRAGEKWRRGRRDMRLVVATDAFEAVGFSIPVAEFIPAARLERHTALRQLGPDVLSDDFDPADVLKRLRTRGAVRIGDALIDQRILAGLGNVYKSEVLFACGVHPFAAIGDLGDREIRDLLDTARKFLRLNVTGHLSPMTTYRRFRRTTRRDDPRERLWVYGRARLPCRRCGTRIEVRTQGPDARLTYWCPRCQPGGHGGDAARGDQVHHGDAGPTEMVVKRTASPPRSKRMTRQKRRPVTG